MSNINLGGLALAIVSGVLGSVTAMLGTGHTSGPSLAGAALAGAATGAVGFVIPPSKTGVSGAQQLAQDLSTAVAVAAPLLPAKAQPAAATVLTQVGGALAAAPAAQAPSSAPTADQWTALLSKLDGLLSQPSTPTAPPPAAGS